MAKLYYKKLIARVQYKGHTMTIDDVPNLWNQEVRDMLAENGYVINEDGTVSKGK